MKDIKILIVGFSGAGKTYLLEKLKQLGETGDDLDQILITQKQFSNSREMIKAIGLDSFRILEMSALENWITHSNNKYLALGGGSVTENSIKLINQYSHIEIIYLNKEFKDCWEGLTARGHSYLADLGIERSRDLYEKRTGLFKQLSNMTEYTNADEFLKRLNSMA